MERGYADEVVDQSFRSNVSSDIDSALYDNIRTAISSVGENKTQVQQESPAPATSRMNSLGFNPSELRNIIEQYSNDEPPQNAYVDPKTQKIYNSPADNTSKIGQLTLENRKFMTDDEVSKFNTLWSSGKMNDALSYHSALKPQLSYRQAQDSGFLKRNLVSGGIENAKGQMMGLANLANNLVGSETPQFYSDELDATAGYQSGAREKNAEGGKLSTLAGDVVAGVAQLLPQAAIATTFGPTVAASAMGVGAAGSYSEEARREGATPAQRLLYGAIGGAAEAGLQKVLFLDKIADFTPSAVIKGGTVNLIKSLGKNATGMAKNALGEGIEEALINPITGLVKKATFNKDMAYAGEGGVFDPKQMAYDGLVGFLSAGIAQYPIMTQQVKASKDFIDENYPQTIVAAMALPEGYESRTIAEKNREGQIQVTVDDVKEFMQVVTDDYKRYAEESRVNEDSQVDNLDHVLLKDASEEFNVEKSIEESDIDKTEEVVSNTQQFNKDDIMEIEGRKYKYVSEEGNNFKTIDVETGKEAFIPKVVAEEIENTGPIEKSLNMEERDFSNVGDRNVNSYQWENPELKPFIQSRASELIADLRATQKGQRIQTDEYGEKWIGQPRVTSDAIVRIKDQTGASYAEIQDSLERIMNDNGQENQALAKRIELVIDDDLTQGYTTFDGHKVEQNEEYVAKRGEIEGVQSLEQQNVDTTVVSEILNDRDNLTIERLNRESNQMEPFTITRGQEYEISDNQGGRERVKVVGISQTKKKIKYTKPGMKGSIELDPGFFYPLKEATAPQSIKSGNEQALSKTIDHENKKNEAEGGWSESDRVVFDEADDTIEEKGENIHGRQEEIRQTNTTSTVESLREDAERIKKISREPRTEEERSAERNFRNIREVQIKFFEGEEIAGLYDPETDTIYLNSENDISYVFSHESFHKIVSEKHPVYQEYFEPLIEYYVNREDITESFLLEFAEEDRTVYRNHQNVLAEELFADIYAHNLIEKKKLDSNLKESTESFMDRLGFNQIEIESILEIMDSIDETDEVQKNSNGSKTRNYIMQETINQYKSGQSGKIKPAHEIVKDVQKAFKLGYTTKRFRSRKAAAHYKEFPQVIEAKVANTLGPLMHELGHHLDQKYKFSTDSETANLVNAMIAEMPDEFKDNYSMDDLPGEAISEFVRMYLTMPGEAINFGGEFYELFEKTIKQNSKDFKNLQSIRNDTLAWLGASFKEQFSSTLVSNLENTSFKRVLKDFNSQLAYARKKGYMYLFNELQPLEDLTKFIEKITGKSLPGAKNFALLADSSLRSPMIAKSITTDAMVNPKGEIVGDSFKSVVSNIEKKDYADFSNYLIGKRALDYNNRGKRAFSNDIPIDYVKMMVEEYEQQRPDFVETAENLYSWWRQFTREWIVGTGLMDGELYDYMNEIEPHYVPFFRLRNENVIIGDAVRQIAQRGYTDKRNPLKRSSMKGGADPIFMPIESMIMEIERYVTTVKRREVMLAIHDVYQSLKTEPSLTEGIGQIINQLPPAMQVESVNMKDKKLDLLLDLNESFILTLPKDEQYEYKSMLMDVQRPDSAVTFRDLIDFVTERGFNSMEIINERIDDIEQEFKPMAIDKEKNIVSVVAKDGNTYHYEVYDPLLLQALIDMDTSHIDALTRLVIGIRRVMQSLITTFDPAFVLIRNPVRDTFQGFTASNIPMNKYHLELAKAIYEEIKGGEWSKAYNRAGGGYASPTGADRNALAESMADVIPGWKKEHKIQAVLQGVEKFSDAIEKAPRIAEYKYHVQQNGDTFESRLEGLYQAQDVTINFQRKGQAMRRGLWNLIPFFNAAMQGIDKFRRMHTQDLKKTLPRALTAVTLITLALYGINRRDPLYKKENKYIKDNYFLIPTGENGKYIRLPKPREIGMIYGATFERTLESVIAQDPTAWEDYFSNLGNAFMPTFDTVFQAYSDAKHNETWYGGQIVPYQYQQLEVDQQYTNTTSKISKQLAKAIPDSWGNLSSPMVLDYLFKQYTGVLGKSIIPATDDTEGNALEFMQRSFTTDVAYSNNVVNKFYERYDEMKKSLDTLKFGRESKGTNKLIAWGMYSDVYESINGLSALHESISELSDADFKATYGEKEKEQVLRFIKLQMLEMADKANLYYDKMVK